MASVIDPVGSIADIADVFAGGAERPDGITFDRELCGAMAAGLAEVAEAVRILAQFVEDASLAERLRLAAERPRTPTERRLLAATAAPLDPEGRVVTFPIAMVPAAVFVTGGTGGSAA